MYMSYCKFEGTFAELRVCLNDVEEHVNEDAEYEISDREIGQFRQMVSYFHEFLQDQELITEDGELDEDRLNEIAEAMAKSHTEDDDDDVF